MEIFDENVAHISTWLYQAEALLDEIEKKPANKKEEIVKVLLFYCKLTRDVKNTWNQQIMF